MPEVKAIYLLNAGLNIEVSPLALHVRPLAVPEVFVKFSLRIYRGSKIYGIKYILNLIFIRLLAERFF